MAQLGKNPPAAQETPVQFLGWGDNAGEGIGYPLQYAWASLVAQLVKNPLAMQKTWVRPLGWEDSCGESLAFWPEEFHGLYSPQGRKESDVTERLSLSTVRVKL